MTQDGAHTKQTSRNACHSAEPRLSLVVTHEGGTVVVPLIRDTRLVVGRTSQSDVVIPEESLSRRHARFTWHANGVWVEDLHSTNGVFFGDQKVQSALMAAGDEVRMGNVVVSLHTIEPQAAMQPVVSEDAFEDWLGGALQMARANQQPLALFMVREIGHRQGHLATWLPRVRELLRSTDRLGLYGPGWLIIGAENTEIATAMRLAEAIVAPTEGRLPPLACAVALAPDHASSVGDLIGLVRGLSQQATANQPVQAPRVGKLDISLDGLIVGSDKMRALHAVVERVAASRVPVLIRGETGVGKEFVARALHAYSSRAKAPLVAVNCGSITESLADSLLFGHERGSFTGADRRRAGFFEQASGGTLFLDEIGELPLSAQAALLRAIEQQRILRVGGSAEIVVDVRIVVATNRDLDQMCETGQFRSDLLYRLNAVGLEVPPLRERAEEIPLLAEHFLKNAGAAETGRVMTFSPKAMEKLKAHEWLGNVRELRNAVERAFVLSNGARIEPEDLPLESRATRRPSTPRSRLAGGAKLKDQVRAFEAELILEALERCQFNQTEAARELAMPVRTLAHKIQLYGLRNRFP